MQHALQNFQLNFTHQLQVDLAQSSVPHHMQLWILVLQGAQGQKGTVGVSSFRQLHPVVQHRFQHRLAGIRLYAKALSGIGFVGPSTAQTVPAGASLTRRYLLPE